MQTHAALSMIHDHGHFAALTCDGVLAHVTVVDTTLDEDRVFDEPTVFEIDDAGCVDREAVMIWLGY